MGLVTQITVCLSKNSLESGQAINSVECLAGMKVSIDLKTEPSLHEPLSIRFATKELPPPIRLQFVNDTKKQHLLSEKGILWPGGDSVLLPPGVPSFSTLYSPVGAPPTFRPQAARQHRYKLALLRNNGVFQASQSCEETG